MALNVKYCIEQLDFALTQEAANAARAEDDARDAARTLATESEKKEDGRAVLEFGSLATGQGNRSRKALENLEHLRSFERKGIPAYTPRSTIGLGAIVDLAQEDEGGFDERTYVILPVGAGTQIQGPGGDGFLTVITPASPVGKALMGKQRGDVIDVTVAGEIREWEITHVG